MELKVLGALLLAADQTVSIARLVDATWDDPPQTADKQVQNAVSRLRALLATAGGPGMLVTESTGYRLRVARESVDAWVFDARVSEAAQATAAGAAEEAARLLGVGLRLWRGPALAGLSGRLIQAAATTWNTRRLAAAGTYYDHRLASGAHHEIVSELEALVADHPMAERPVGQLMSALYRAGRRAEAIAAYRQASRLLATELQVGPGPELNRLHEQILTGAEDPTAGLGEATARPELPRLQQRTPAGADDDEPPPTERWPPTLCQLPADLPDFVGREKVLAHLVDMLTGARDDGDHAVPVVGVTGPAGVGKTALALHAAHRLRMRFPDGQLFIDLRGARAPLDPADVLARLMRAVGMDGAVIPADLDERAAAWRGRLADRRVLLVLDNAASEAQVRPLLPGGAGCAVLMTSRVRLSALSGAGTVTLDVLEPGQAAELLSRIAGAQRVGAEPDAAQAITDSCDRLPLAVRIAGARLVARPHWPLARLATRLADQRGRLDELHVGDLALRASIALSYQALAPDARRLLRRLGLLRTITVRAFTAAALLDVDLDTGERMLDELADAHLTQATSDDDGEIRYRQHDLIHLYGREQAEREDPVADRREALRRALGAWLTRAESAGRRLPGNRPCPVRPVAPRWAPPSGPDAGPPDPVRWFDTELANLVGAVEQAAHEAEPGIAWELANCLSAFCELRGYQDEWGRAVDAARRAAATAGDRQGEAQALRLAGDRYLLQPRYPEAIECYRAAWPTLHELGEHAAETRTLAGLGEAEMYASRLGDARTHLDEAAALAETAGGDRTSIANIARARAWVDRRSGHTTQALARLGEAVELYRRCGDRQGEGVALFDLGEVMRTEGQLADAARYLADAAAIFEELADRRSLAYVAKARGVLETRTGQPDRAYASLTKARELFDAMGDPVGVAYTDATLSDLYEIQNQLERAVDALCGALPVFRERGIPLWEGRALARLGRIQARTGAAGHARASLSRAIDILQPIAPAETPAITAALHELTDAADNGAAVSAP